MPVDLTIAMDAFTRCIIGVQLTPLSTKARDVANVLYQAVTPPRTPTTTPRRGRSTAFPGKSQTSSTFHISSAVLEPAPWG